MANSIDLITKYGTKAWDKVYKAESCSSVLDGDRDLLKFTGVKTVKIAKFASTGLATYNRANAQVDGNYAGSETAGGATGKGYGYQQGGVSLAWEEFTINCDRGTQLRIELFDDEETDGLAVAMATKEFSRTKVIPEVDAYVFSKLAEYAGTTSTSTIELISGTGYNKNGPVQALNDAFEALSDCEVPENEQVIFCSNKFYNQLRSTGEVVKVLRQTEYNENVKFTIGEYEGREIIAVPANRFRTLIKLNGDDGYTWNTGSQKIDFIVVDKGAVAHVTKYDKVKVFGPDVVQDFDGYKVNIRIYHDVFVPDNKRVGIYAHVSSDEAADLAPKLSYNRDATSGLISGLYLVPGDTIVDGLYAYKNASAPAVGASVDAAFLAKCTPIANLSKFNPTKPSSGTDKYFVIATYNNKVVAVNETPISIAA